MHGLMESDLCSICRKITLLELWQIALMRDQSPITKLALCIFLVGGFYLYYYLQGSKCSCHYLMPFEAWQWKMPQISVLSYFTILMVKLDSDHTVALLCLLVGSHKITFLIKEPFSYYKANLEWIQCVFNLSLIKYVTFNHIPTIHHVLSISDLN